MDLGLRGKRAVVTGGSRGIGRAVVRALVAEGMDVAFCARRQEGIDALLAELDGAGSVHGEAVDATDVEALGGWVDRSAERLGGIDVAVSNTSALGGIPPTLEGWRRSFDGDIAPAVTVVTHARPHLAASDGGSFVQIGTITAVEHHAYEGGGEAYGALKAALINYVTQLAQTLAGDGIRANCVSPGPIYFADGSWGYLEQRMPGYFEENRAHHPMGRFGTGEEVANVVAFLASPVASWVTGENVVVDGGFTRRVAF